MSDDNKTTNISLFNAEIPDSVDNALKNLTDNPTLNVGQTIADCWYLIFGPISKKAEKRRIKYAHDIELFKKELEHETSKIDSNNRIEPKVQTVMPAMENAKYCVEEPELRKMFAKLISASMDKSKMNLTHPSFADILKTMTPLDAQNLKLFSEYPNLPICDVKQITKNQSGYTIVLNNFFLENPQCSDFMLQSISISSLIRLGILDIPTGVFIIDSSKYKIYEDNIPFRSTSKDISYKLERNVVTLTPLGKAFLKVCCS